MDAKDRVIEEQRELIEELTQRVRELELALAKATKDSSNSSKSPSSDIIKPAKKSPGGKASRKKRKRGGQPGHRRKLREPLPPERVDEAFMYEMSDAEVRDRNLTPTDEFEIIQHVELLDIPIHVTEYRLRQYLTSDGRTVVTQGRFPEQDMLGSDESSLKNNGKKHWIWCITAPLFTLFHIAGTRGRKVLEELIGVDFSGTVHFDYFSSNCSFAWNFWIKAQYCWAHLVRDIRFLEKHPSKKAKKWAGKLLDRTRRMFVAWHRRDAMSDAGRRRSFTMHRNKFLEIVRNPPDAPEARILAERFAIVECVDGSRYDMSQDYFRFLFEVGVEPTNNHTEQQIRHCVLDRRVTQGTRSERGQRYHERMWTAIATCAKQGRGFFDFLHDSIQACLEGQPGPSLLPAERKALESRIEFSKAA